MPVVSKLILAVLNFALAIPLQSQTLSYNDQNSKLSLEKMSKSLSDIFRDSAVGWAYTIWENGKLKYSNQGGYKVTPADMADNRGVLFLPDTKIHVASFSKTITAVAVAKLVQQGRLGWQDHVSKYLPADWKIDPGFETLTLAQLVSMKSGINEPLNAGSSYYDSLKVIMEKGPDRGKVDTFHYQNASYGLLRVIIAYAAGYRPFSAATGNAVSSASIAHAYKKYVNTHILEPAGISDADCKITDEIPAFHYPFPYNNEPGELTGSGAGLQNGDLSEYAGAFGWYLSAGDAGKFANAVFVKRNILSEEVFSQLVALGFPFRIRKGIHGEYVGSGGDWGHPVKPTGWRGIHAYYYWFPGNIIVTVFVNSGEGSPTQRVLRAYNSAFTSQKF
jgi:CubicO group peptidase (beta-lactamase class C family)